MKSKLVAGVISLLLSVSLLTALFAVRTPAAEAGEIRQLLETALSQIEVPGPGQIVHYSYTVYHRSPPAGLEPGDPYHLPYKEIWPARQFEETWLEIDPQGKTVRWRTQLRSEDGELLQDAMFDNGVESDYNVSEGIAFRFPTEVRPFRDVRVALIEDFLQKEELSRRQNFAPDGQPVLSVYAKATNLQGSAWASQSIEEALLSFSRPFVADLKPVSEASRIDFDPSTFLPAGEARVVWDRSGAEHVISYRTFSEPEILPGDQASVVFHQEIPEWAFQDSFSAPAGTQSLGTLEQVVQHVDYPLYVLDDPTLQLVATSLTIPDPTRPFPAFVRGIELAASLGVGVQMIYVNEENTAKLRVIQGSVASMRDALRQTRPTWTQAERLQLRLGNDQVVAWALTGPEPDQMRYVIEAGDTILYLASDGLAPEQVLDLLQRFAPVK